jgi:hypothetical protein
MIVRKSLIAVSLVSFIVIMTICLTPFVFAYENQSAAFGMNIKYGDVIFTSASSSGSTATVSTDDKTLTIDVGGLTCILFSKSSVTVTCKVKNIYSEAVTYNGYTEESNEISSKATYEVSGLTKGTTISPNEEVSFTVKITTNSGFWVTASGALVLKFDYLKN